MKKKRENGHLRKNCGCQFRPDFTFKLIISVFLKIIFSQMILDSYHDFCFCESFRLVDDFCIAIEADGIINHLIFSAIDLFGDIGL